MIREKRRRLICGVGINDSDYVTVRRENGRIVWRCPYYVAWSSMIERCYNHTKPSYQQCEVCEEWKTFSRFKEWMKIQDWQEKQLDKDILGDGSTYSPKTCCFVPGWLNNIFGEKPKSNLPVGVSQNKPTHKYRVKISANGKRVHIGYFKTLSEASSAYQKAKRQHIKTMMEDYDNEIIKAAVLRKVGE